MRLFIVIVFIVFPSVAYGKPTDYMEETECPGYNACHEVFQDKINVHIVPHSHDDVGWLLTVDQYFYKKVQYIISSVVTYLQENPDRRFIQVETSYFYMWWNLQNDATKSQVRQLINEGRLEIANGAWSMNDEAAVHYQSTIDQYTLGLRFIEDVLGKCARPKAGWQIDPFGHSREHASLLGQMGLDSVFFARLDYRDKQNRLDHQTMDLLWTGSSNLDADTSTIFTSVLYDHYSAPSGFCFDKDCDDLPVIINPESTEYNWEDRVIEFTNYTAEQAKYYPTNNILVTFGGDFQWRNAEQGFLNIDRLIAGFKKFNPTIHGTELNVIYSTPACYAKAVRDYIEVNKMMLEVKTDDFFPYADGGNTVWAGYFSSRPTSKRLERVANNLLQVSKQVTAFGGQFYGSISRLSHAMGVLQHHDAITGTEKEAVKRDYHKTVVAGMEQAISEISISFSSILGIDGNLNLKSCLLSNVSICSESDKDQFNVLIYNPLARTTSHYIQVPVNDGTWKVTGPTGEEIESHLTYPARNFEYITNDIGEKILPKVLIFKAENLPPLGYKVYSFQKSSDLSSSTREQQLDANQIGFEDRYVTIDLNTGLVKSITLNGVTLGVSQKLLYYNGSTGVSGAYIFRPDTKVREAVEFGYVQTSVLLGGGEMVREIKQVWEDWITQVIRVFRDEDFVEFDWVVGPIDTSNGLGKEVITRYSTELETDGVFYTDSNGREMIYRKKNYRPTYTYTTEEPQAGNYYPVNTKILVKDEVNEFAVLTDRSEGGSSLSPGEVELMLSRVAKEDDQRGVGENLNETEYAVPLVARGSHFVTLGKSSEGNGGRTMAAVERDIAQRKHLQPWVFYTTEDVPVKEQSFLNKELPPNVHLLTLESWNTSNTLLIRLEHILEKDEDPNLSQEVTVDLTDLFKTIKIVSMKEFTLAANTPLEESERLEWSQIVHSVDAASPLNKEKKLARDETDLKVALAPMQIRTFVASVEIQ
ncbi:lysosomal alpha-mannosidase isoform X2 [Anoplophora glabripennis]|uniref:lysosomal alpha-mannosidase isoform X2 n=1 Tax=Anoplophora glabripennis TaxID=217634 RepID=UPI00087435F5|nr:lysosomal alpha-mannosidase isoform X2 [Anoplophora glabripennis]